MLVKEMLNKIMVKEMTIKELADQFDVSTRTIQLKIKKLGYEWDKVFIVMLEKNQNL
ncbi:HTH domain-containing protein [Priestia megaterium]|uniref:HTH domain-containing protein n=1 Tax=Priestia megaterium TaxID=1404 RepID=UPI002E1DF76E|nr:HTH domain-containing protein [Priestia megaterium]